MGSWQIAATQPKIVDFKLAILKMNNQMMIAKTKYFHL